MSFASGIDFSLSQWKSAQCRSKMSTTDLYSEENLKSFKSSASLVVKVREEAGGEEILIFKAGGFSAREQDSVSARQCLCDVGNHTGSGCGGLHFLHSGPYGAMF